MDQMGASNQVVGSYAAQVLEAVCHETAQWAIWGDSGSTVLCLRRLFLRFLNSIMSRKSLRINGPDERFKPDFWVVCCSGFESSVPRDCPMGISGDFWSIVLCLQGIFSRFLNSIMSRWSSSLPAPSEWSSSSAQIPWQLLIINGPILHPGNPLWHSCQLPPWFTVRFFLQKLVGFYSHGRSLDL
jgi:hypothetical protein